MHTYTILHSSSMCVCVFLCVCAHVHVCVCVYMYMYVCVCMCVHAHVCVCVCTCVCVHAHVSVHVYVCMCVCLTGIQVKWSRDVMSKSHASVRITSSTCFPHSSNIRCCNTGPHPPRHTHTHTHTLTLCDQAMCGILTYSMSNCQRIDQWCQSGKRPPSGKGVRKFQGSSKYL